MTNGSSYPIQHMLLPTNTLLRYTNKKKTEFAYVDARALLINRSHHHPPRRAQRRKGVDGIYIYSTNRYKAYIHNRALGVYIGSRPYTSTFIYTLIYTLIYIYTQDTYSYSSMYTLYRLYKSSTYCTNMYTFTWNEANHNTGKILLYSSSSRYLAQGKRRLCPHAR